MLERGFSRKNCIINCLNMYGVPDFYQNDNVKKGTGMQWRHQVVSDLPKMEN